MRVPLRRIAHARSGDKGNISNVGVFAYEDAFYPAIKATSTAERFAARHAGVVRAGHRRPASSLSLTTRWAAAPRANSAWTITARHWRRRCSTSRSRSTTIGAASAGPK
jgi:hypothetical protein